VSWKTFKTYYITCVHLHSGHGSPLSYGLKMLMCSPDKSFAVSIYSKHP